MRVRSMRRGGGEQPPGVQRQFQLEDLIDWVKAQGRITDEDIGEAMALWGLATEEDARQAILSYLDAPLDAPPAMLQEPAPLPPSTPTPAHHAMRRLRSHKPRHRHLAHRVRKHTKT